MSLAKKTLKNSYIDLLQMDNSNGGISAITRRIKDGGGNSSAIALSDDIVAIQPVNDDTGGTLVVTNKSGTTLLQVDASTPIVQALGNTVNTQYATFSTANVESATFAANTHQALTFGHSNYGASGEVPAFGTSTDPATTFTTSEGADTRASCLVPVMWYVPDAISIDSINSIEGADAATGDTTRMHLFSYTFTSGATNCLTSGALLAHNSDVSNSGSEQVYLTTWTIDSASVAAGKVILAFFRSDSVSSDYSVQITVKYHLTLT